MQSVPQSTGPPSLIATTLHTDVPSGILTRCLNDTSQSDVQMAEPRDPLKCRQAGDGAGEGYTATSGTHVDWQGSATLLPPVNLLEPSLPCWRVRGQWRHLSPSPTPPSRLEPLGHWLLAPGPRALADTAGMENVAGRAPPAPADPVKAEQTGLRHKEQHRSCPVRWAGVPRTRCRDGWLPAAPWPGAEDGPAHACWGPTTQGSPPQVLSATTRRPHGGLTAAPSPPGRAPAPPPPVLRPFSGRETADWLLHCCANACLWGSVGWAVSDSTWAHVTSSGSWDGAGTESVWDSVSSAAPPTTLSFSLS